MSHIHRNNHQNDVLTPKQQAFVVEYLKDLNATQAAIRAGYSRATARVQGPRLLSNVAIQQQLAAAFQARDKQAKVESERLEREAERISISDIRRLFRNGCLLPPEEIPDDLAPAISSIEVVTKEAGKGKILYVNKIRLWDKNTAQRTIFQMRGDGKVNEKNLNVKGDVTIRQITEETERAMKHLTNEEFERAATLAKEIVRLHGEQGKILDIGLARAAESRSGAMTDDRTAIT